MKPTAISEVGIGVKMSVLRLVTMEEQKKGVAPLDRLLGRNHREFAAIFTGSTTSRH